MAASNSPSRIGLLLIVAASLSMSSFGAECTTPTTVVVEPWPLEWEGELFRQDPIVATLRSVELSFVEAGTVKDKKGKTRTNYVPEFRIVANVTGVEHEISRQIGAQFEAQVPHNCNTRRAYHGANVRADGGVLNVDAGMRVELWTCTIFDLPCCQLWPPKCDMCRHSIELKVLQVDPSARGTVSLVPTADKRSVEIAADIKFDDNLSEDQKNLVRGVVFVLGGAIGGPLGAVAGPLIIENEYKKYSNIGFRGVFHRIDRDFSTPTTGQLSVVSSMFEDRNGERLALLHQHGDGSIGEEEAKELCTYFTVKRANATRKAQGITSVTVEKGDTLWDIADRLYGDGKYFPVLEYANPEVAALEPGMVLNIPDIDPLDDDETIIRRGDTLWDMAERIYGDGSQWRKLLPKSSKKITDPDYILPLWKLDIQKPVTPEAQPQPESTPPVQ